MPMTTSTNGHHAGGPTPDAALRSRRTMTVTSPPSNSFLLGGQVYSATKSKKRLRNPKRLQQRKQRRSAVIFICFVLGLCMLVGLVYMALSTSPSSDSSYGGRVVEQLRKRRKSAGDQGRDELYNFRDPTLTAAAGRQLQHDGGGGLVEAARALEEERLKRMETGYGQKRDALSQLLLKQEKRKVHFHLPRTMVHEQDEEQQPPVEHDATSTDDAPSVEHDATSTDDAQHPRKLAMEDDTKKSGRSPKQETKGKESSKQKEEFRPKPEKKRPIRREHKDGEAFPVRPLTDLSPEHHNPAPAKNTLNQPAPAGTPPPLVTLSNMDNHSLVSSSSCSAQLEQHKGQTTLVVQSSLDRAWLLQETCRRWSDPIVAVLVLNHLESHQEFASYLNEWSVTCPQMRVLTHTLHSSSSSQKNTPYPVNRLRNLGLEAARTTHVLVVDVDFIPSHNLQDEIRNALELQRTIQKASNSSEQKGSVDVDNTHHRALIVPAFERTCDDPDECTTLHLNVKKDSAFLPRSFDELRACVLHDKQCMVFQNRDNWEGHSSTNSAQWLAQHFYQNTTATILANGTALYDLRQLPCFESLRYEPYVVIPWCPQLAGQQQDSPSVNSKPHAPFYDERFHGYGKNKIEYISHLRFLQYRFAILPRGFLVHNPHGNSQAKESWLKSSSDVHQEMDLLYPQFLQELAQKYFLKDFSWLQDYPNVVGLCEATKKAIRHQQEKHEKKEKPKQDLSRGTGDLNHGNKEEKASDEDGDDDDDEDEEETEKR